MPPAGSSQRSVNSSSCYSRRGFERIDAVLRLRPARLGAEPTSRPIGFWIERGQEQEFVVLSDGSPEEDLPTEHEGTPLRVVTPAELAAHSVWIGNW